MAQRRMLNISLITSDDFSDLQHSAQVLYFHLNMEADDDGFVGNAVKLMRSLKIQKRSLEALADNGYVILFDSGVVAVSHWHCHNSLRKDRYVKTRYVKELSQLHLNSEGKYEFLDTLRETDTFCQPNDGEALPQCSIDKDSIDKDSIEKNSTEKNSTEKNSIDKCIVEDACADSSAEPPITENKNTNTNNGDIYDFEFEEFEIANENIVTLAECSMLKNAHGNSLYAQMLTREQREKYKRFLLNLYKYLIANLSKIDPIRFIKYNEDRNWKGVGGESVVKNYKKYVQAWESNEYGAREKNTKLSLAHPKEM